MSKNFSQTPTPAAIVEKLTIGRAQKAKLRRIIQRHRSRGLPTKISSCPLLPLYTITAERKNTHPFPQNIEFTRQTLQIAYFPATILPPLIPAIILPLHLETRSALPEVRWTHGTVMSSPSHQSISHFSEKHEVPFVKCIGFTGPLINIYYSRLSRNKRYHSKIHLRRKSIKKKLQYC